MTSTQAAPLQFGRSTLREDGVQVDTFAGVSTIRHKEQEKRFVKRYVERGLTLELVAVVQWGDGCHNGHNDLSVTGTIYKVDAKGRRAEWEAGGCLHEEIVRHFPELKRAVDFHLAGTDGPMYYVENTIYLAGDLDCWKLRKGQQTFREVKGLEWLDSAGEPWPVKWTPEPIVSSRCDIWGALASLVGEPDKSGVRVVAVPYSGNDKQTKFSDNYTIESRSGHLTPAGDWYAAPFRAREDAEAFVGMLQRGARIVTFLEVDRVGEGKDRQLDAARKCAIWPDATDEELTQEPKVLRAALQARLPGLVMELRGIVEGFGFEW